MASSIFDSGGDPLNLPGRTERVRRAACTRGDTTAVPTPEPPIEQADAPLPNEPVYLVIRRHQAVTGPLMTHSHLALQEELRAAFQALEDAHLQLHVVLIHESPLDEENLRRAEAAAITYLEKLREVMQTRGLANGLQAHDLGHHYPSQA